MKKNMSQYSGTKKLFGEEFATELFTDLQYTILRFISFPVERASSRLRTQSLH